MEEFLLRSNEVKKSCNLISWYIFVRLSESKVCPKNKKKLKAKTTLSSKYEALTTVHRITWLTKGVHSIDIIFIVSLNPIYKENISIFELDNFPYLRIIFIMSKNINILFFEWNRRMTLYWKFKFKLIFEMNLWSC